MSAEDVSHKLWPAHKLAHNVYFKDMDDEQRHLSFFKDNHIFIENANISRKGNHFCRHNYLSHWSHDEYLAWLTVNTETRPKPPTLTQKETSLQELTRKQPPPYLNWKDQGKVTAVKDQGKCGGSWAFSATGAIESAHAIQTEELVTLSEQQLLDCCTWNHGCDSGLTEFGISYVSEAGQMHDSDYPYEAQVGTCKYSPTADLVHIHGYEYVKPDDDSVMYACAEVGPLAIAINASSQSFQFYAGGIYYDPLVPPTPTNHAVVLVGYGTLGEEDYWYVKNSWGTLWGEQGYIYIRRHHDNYLGVTSAATGILV